MQTYGNIWRICSKLMVGITKPFCGYHFSHVILNFNKQTYVCRVFIVAALFHDNDHWFLMEYSWQRKTV